MNSSRRAPERWDVLVIGARGAGATLAAYLGRAGVRVLCVDKSPLPSDVVLSTHTLHPAGVLAPMLQALAEVNACLTEIDTT